MHSFVKSIVLIVVTYSYSLSFKIHGWQFWGDFLTSNDDVIVFTNITEINGWIDNLIKTVPKSFFVRKILLIKTWIKYWPTVYRPVLKPERIKITPEPFGVMASNLSNMMLGPSAFIWLQNLGHVSRAVQGGTNQYS